MVPPCNHSPRLPEGTNPYCELSSLSPSNTFVCLLSHSHPLIPTGPILSLTLSQSPARFSAGGGVEQQAHTHTLPELLFCLHVFPATLSGLQRCVFVCRDKAKPVRRLPSATRVATRCMQTQSVFSGTLRALFSKLLYINHIPFPSQVFSAKEALLWGGWVGSEHTEDYKFQTPKTMCRKETCVSLI